VKTREQEKMSTLASIICCALVLALSASMPVQAQIIAASPSSNCDERWAGPRGSQALITAAYDEIVGQ